jgi:hypothetical protein
MFNILISSNYECKKAYQHWNPLWNTKASELFKIKSGIPSDEIAIFEILLPKIPILRNARIEFWHLFGNG